MMRINIEMATEIKDWDILASMEIDVSGKSDDILIGNIQANRILSNAKNDILINHQINVICDNEDPLLGQVSGDTISIGFGNDIFDNSIGLDPLFGNTDGDILYGSSEDVTLVGGKESDRIFYRSGNDSLQGNLGGGFLYGDSEKDILIAGNDNDYIWSGEEDNFLLAKADNEKLLGEAGNQIIYEQSGNDIIHNNVDLIYKGEQNNYQSDVDTGDSDSEGATDRKVLLDADIILDVLLERECPTLEDSVAAFDLISSKRVKGYIASSDLEQIVSLVQRLHNPENAKRIEQKLLNFLEVCEVDGQLLRDTSQISLPNFKNTIQLACVLRNNLDAIVTLNSQDFWGDENDYPDINVFTPSQFLDRYYGLDLDEYVDFREKLEKDLEANCMLNEEILDEKLSLGTGWVVDNWIVRCAQNNFTEATVIVRNPETSEQYTEYVIAKGPIEASCKALDKLVKQLYELPEYSFKDFLTRNVSDEGAAATVEATVIVKCDDLTYTSDYTHRSITQAVFYAYVKSVDKILRRETPEKADKAVNNFVNKLKLAKGLL